MENTKFVNVNSKWSQLQFLEAYYISLEACSVT